MNSDEAAKLYWILTHIFDKFFIDGVDYETKNKLFEMIDKIINTHMAYMHMVNEKEGNK